MHSFLSWFDSHQEVVWIALSALLTWLFKPRTAAEYAQLPPRIAAVLRLIGALGLDVPNVLKALRVLFSGAPKPPSVLPPQGPTFTRSDDTPMPETPSETPEAKLRTRTTPRPTMLRFAGVAFAAVIFCSGCGLLRTVEPVLTDVVAIATDAQQVLALVDLAANAFFDAHPDLTSAKATYTSIMMRTHAALDAAIRALRGVTELGQAQIDAAFADFRSAYADLIALLQSFGVATSPSALAAGPGHGVPIPQPLILTYRVPVR